MLLNWCDGNKDFTMNTENDFLIQTLKAPYSAKNIVLYSRSGSYFFLYLKIKALKPTYKVIHALNDRFR